jgi:hypothetical protein
MDEAEMSKRFYLALFICLALVASPFAWLYARNGMYGINVVLRRGGSVWPSVTPDDPRLTPAVRLALTGAVGTPGALTWSEPRAGFEVGDLPILVGGQPVDRLLLARIDPARWRFSVHTAPAGDHDIDRWMRELGAALVVNGSYFGLKGEPDTPLLSEGVAFGPSDYKSSHGAFVASAAGASVIDLKSEDWRQAFVGKNNALVSYPLLLDDSGASRATPSKWLAGRSFVAQDRAGRIIIGTSADAFLTLDGLANVLRKAPLDLATALNLDGGPVACQSIELGVYRRRTCGPLELQVDGNKVQLLQPLIAGNGWALPIVIAVTPQ